MSDFFHPVDHLFAQKMLKKDEGEDTAFFLAYLLASARLGHLCVRSDASHWSPQLGEEEDLRLSRGALAHSDERVVREGNRWYLKRLYDLEQTVLKQWARLLKEKPEIEISPESLQKELENTSLLPEQKRAIQRAAQFSISLITGGPGTGKSFTAAALVKLFSRYIGSEIIVAAPTGKAAGNLKQKLAVSQARFRVCTLHSLLAKQETLFADLIIVDESAMIDAKKFGQLLSAIKQGARLVLIGDKDQLPPVESGHLFADLFEDAQDHSTSLVASMRTDLKEILDLATLVNAGQKVPLQPLPKPQLLARNWIEKLKTRSGTCALLSPLRQGPYGTEHLNRLIADMAPDGDIPIIITRNDKTSELANGDVGLLKRNEGCALFEGREIPQYLLPSYDYAYALSVHKSQGSEYDEVVVLLPPGCERFGKEMLYTAITRARKKVVILGAEKTLEDLLSHNSGRLSGARKN